MGNQIDISVVICTYNRAALLSHALNSLVAQQCPPGLEYELIVVDDGSTDTTADVVREIKRCTDRRVSYIEVPGRGISAARNAGVHAARGEWVAFTDDDQVADRVWLWNLWYAQRKSGAPCIGGSRTLDLCDDVLRKLPAPTRLVLGEIAPQGELRECVRDTMLCTGNLLVHRSIIVKLGGFDESLTQGGEDTDLIMRLRRAGHTSWFTPHAVVRHIIPPYRLQAGYLRWAAIRGGECFALRDAREWGLPKACSAACARLLLAASVDVPAMAWARARGNVAEAVARRCRVARAFAYARRAATLTVAAVCSNKNTASNTIVFRNERQLFDRTAG